MTEPTDDQLMLLFQDGDAAAFATLFERHRASVYNYAAAVLNHQANADDVLQETFLAVARHVKGYEPRGKFRPWLFRVARNQCLNLLAAERRREALRKDAGANDAAKADDPSENLQTDERAAAIRTVMRLLPERQREALTLYAFEGMAYSEIAQVLEMPVNTVKTLIHRARTTLARMFESQGDGDEL